MIDTIPRLALKRRFDVHGVHFTIDVEDETLSRAVDEVLAIFFDATPYESGHSSHIVLRDVMSRASVPIDVTSFERVTRVLETGGLSHAIYRSGDRWLIDLGPVGMVAIDVDRRIATAYVVRPSELAPDRPAAILKLAVMELLRVAGLYAVHASVVARGAAGIAFVGPSGHGKTTAAIAMTRAGFRCLSDDLPLLRDRAETLSFLPFPYRFSVSDRTIAWFDELSDVARTFRSDSRKRSFASQTVYAEADDLTPVSISALVFPQIVDAAESVLEPLAKTRALEELLPQSLLVLDKETASKQFAVLAHLVKTTPCYRLHFGEDVQSLPALVSRTLAL